MAVKKTDAMHETYDREEPVTGSSDRGFGIVFACVFALLALYNLWHDGTAWRWLAAIALLFLALAFIRPRLLSPLNRAWTRLGMILYHVTNPIILGMIFFLFVTPLGLVMRLAGKDFLRRQIDPKAKSYWIRREPPGPPPDSMKNQF